MENPLALPLVIAGPTASGKSDVAVAMAERLNGVVVNADSRQLYDGLPVLSALPSSEMKRRVPHKLYGIWGPDHASSVALWLEAFKKEWDLWCAQGKIPVIVGGTGFYIRALLEGMPVWPPIDPDITQDIQRAYHKGRELWAWLHQLDPHRAQELAPADTYRLQRSLEVVLQTGRSIRSFHTRSAALIPRAYILTLQPPRMILRERIQRRLAHMVEQGVWDEVAQLAQQGLSEDAPVFKTLGSKPLLQALRGEISHDHALQKTFELTCQYAKRQSTWFRHQLCATLCYDTVIHEAEVNKKADLFLNSYYSFCENQKGS